HDGAGAAADRVAGLGVAGGRGLDDLPGHDLGPAGGHRLVGLLHARADLLRLVLVRRTAADLDQALAGDGVPLGSDRAGLDDHDADGVRRELDGQAGTQPLHGELGRVVPRTEGLVELPADAADVDDPARLLG